MKCEVGNKHQQPTGVTVAQLPKSSKEIQIKLGFKSSVLKSDYFCLASSVNISAHNTKARVCGLSFSL